ncbi:MAG: GntR family transcriptional regulator [Bacillota bacterium]|nr:GntR family transcriptional regulator [Bacillota bacterium]
MEVVISNSSGQPLYEQISSQIKSKILSGELRPGEALPSMRALAAGLRISVITTKRAYEDLEREGFIETVGGKGSFVSAIDADLLREEHLRRAEAALAEAASIARAAGVGCEELLAALKLIYEGA